MHRGKIRIVVRMKGVGGDCSLQWAWGFREVLFLFFCHKTQLLTAGVTRGLHSDFCSVVKGQTPLCHSVWNYFPFLH